MRIVEVTNWPLKSESSKAITILRVCFSLIINSCWPQVQVRHLDTSEKSEFHKLQQLKDEQGLFSASCSLISISF